MTLDEKKCREGLLHFGLIAKRVRAAAPHEGDDNTHSGPTGRGAKTALLFRIDALRNCTVN